MNLQRRLAALNESKSDWVKHVKHIDDKYNNTEHHTIQLKPVDAVKPANNLWISWHLWNNAKRNRKYPEIKYGQMVRIKISQKKTAKGHNQTFTKTHIKLLV